MAPETPQPEAGSLVVYVPRWRIFAYRAVGWRVVGALAEDFVEIVWPGPGEPVWVSPGLPSQHGDENPGAQRDVA